MKKEISFGAWLYKQRRSLDLTRKAFADQVGCAQVTLRRIENDTLKPSKELALVLLEKLGIPENDRLQWVQFARGLTGHPEQTVGSSPVKPLTNLPSLLTTFIGREKEQAEIIKHLNKYRLVTLTGSGGVGKTRLSIKVGEQVLGDYPHGVWLVELASLSDPALLPQTIIKVFGIATQSDIPLIEILVNFLHAKTTLLILDNCEHLLDACTQLADTLLKNCPNLKVLATSREPLGITGEAIYRVPSLGLPHVERVLETFRDFESVRLFEERAQLVQTDFSLTLENASFIAQICSRLDGIPLALELAAAKAHMLSTKQIAEQLEESFNLLTGGSRTALPRQQTIHASISWSWSLLTEPEQSFMQQISVFAGGWTLEAAESTVSGMFAGKPVFDLITSLLDKNLLQRTINSSGTTRFNMLITIQEFALERLRSMGNETDMRDRHLEYFRELAKQANPYLRGAQQLVWLDRLEMELANLRAALVWASHGGSVQAGLDLMADISDFWIYRTYVKQNRVYAENLLARPAASEDIRAHAKGLLVAGNLAYFAGDFVMERTHLEAGEVLWQQLGDAGRPGLAETRDLLIDLDYRMNHDLPLARRRFEDNLTLCREAGDPWLIAQAIYEIAWVAEREGDLCAAQRGYAACVSLFRDQGDEIRACEIINADLGPITFRMGDYAKARLLLEEGINIARLAQHQLFLDIPLHLLGVLAAQEGDFPHARVWYTECLRFEQEMAETRQVARCLIGFAGIATAENRIEQAVRLLGAAETQIEAKGTWWAEDVNQGERERLAKLLPTLLDEETFAATWSEGCAMTMEQAIAFALEVTHE